MSDSNLPDPGISDVTCAVMADEEYNNLRKRTFDAVVKEMYDILVKSEGAWRRAGKKDMYETRKKMRKCLKPLTRTNWLAK